MVMRVVSWNIELGRNVDRAIAELSEFSELSAADVILLQEMSPESTEAIAAGLDLGWRFGAVADSCDTGRPFGNAVLSRWPMSEATTLALPMTARLQPQPRCAVHVEVEVDGAPISAVSIHLETVLLSRRGRALQATTAARCREINRAQPTIVGGDFNSASGRSIRSMDRSMIEAGLRRVTRNRPETFRRFGLPFTLDHLYARGVASTGSGVVGDARASDHQPIWADFEPLVNSSGPVGSPGRPTVSSTCDA